jgi:hypothetical protein
MVPFISASVICVGILSKGGLHQAAIVTRVFSADDTSGGPVAVNLMVMPDMAVPVPMGDVLLFEAEQDALAYRALHHSATVAYWPTKG